MKSMLEVVENPELGAPSALPADPVLGAEGLAGEPPSWRLKDIHRGGDEQSGACQHHGEVVLCRRCGRGVAAAERLLASLGESWWREPPGGSNPPLRRAG
jgi:hypothetical protein